MIARIIRLRRALSPTFPAGEMVFFIPWRDRSERATGSTPPTPLIESRVDWVAALTSFLTLYARAKPARAAAATYGVIDNDRQKFPQHGHGSASCFLSDISGWRDRVFYPLARVRRGRATNQVFRFSSPSGLAGPAAHETLLLCGCVVGTEVGILLVRLSPSFSWTRGSWSTSDCRHGPSSAPEHAS